MKFLKIIILFLIVAICNSCNRQKFHYTELLFGGVENKKLIQESSGVYLSVVVYPLVNPDEYAREHPGEPMPYIYYGVEDCKIKAGPVLASRSDFELLKRIVLLDSSYLYGENADTRLCDPIYSLRADFITNNDTITLMIDLRSNQMGIFKNGVDINDAIICYIDKIHPDITNIYANTFPLKVLLNAFHNGSCG